MISFWILNLFTLSLVASQSNLIINNSTNITYNYNLGNCSILDSNSTAADVKCLILCQKITCQALEFDVSSNSCILFYGNPSLIQYETLSGLNITYILNTYIPKGQNCIFNFTCDTQSGFSCINGACCLLDASKYTQGLAYEWTFNNNLVDDVQCVRLTANTAIGSMQWINESSLVNSVYLSGGAYLYAPSGVYFQNVFTLTTWFYPTQFTGNARVLDFANGAPSSNVILSYAAGGGRTPFFETFSNSASKGQVTTSSQLSANCWNHIAAVLDQQSKAYLYINGTLVGSITANAGLINKTRANNYIGKSQWGDGYTYGRFKNLRIYNIALNASGVQNDMTN